MAKRCLCCYRELEDQEVDFHKECSKRFFGSETPPELPYSLAELADLAKSIVRSSITVPGVQPKLSMIFDRKEGMHTKTRLTIAGVLGNYILKPPTETYPDLPEVEDLTMHLADILKIRTVPHVLLRLKSGELAYITRRIDRIGNKKIHMEDMCQLAEKPSESKYRGSMEKIGKIIMKYSDAPGLDIINLFEITLFSFMTGNADMHLKNFSLIRQEDSSMMLAPAYDLVATRLLIPKDPEEMALTIDGKKNKITTDDFRTLAGYIDINEKALQNIYDRFRERLPELLAFVDMSFLDDRSKKGYKTLIRARAERLGLC